MAEKELTLPQKFLARMKDMLGDEYDEFVLAFDKENPYVGMRISPLKENAKEAVLSEIGDSERVLWCENGYYTDKKTISGKHPYHVGGLVYFQEPSAMLTVEALPIEKGDFVLDLCAAPGGKATQAAEKLGGCGLLVANEIIPKRASILAENIQRMGIKNAVVTNETPEKLSAKYTNFFDKIIVDAPCSGEGMFKKEPQAITEWSEEHTISCGQRQKNILQSAFKMLKGGGYLVYSTCTFAPCENEEVVLWVLANYPEIELVPISTDGVSNGNAKWADSDLDFSGTKRIFPHKSKGEGHFTALFHKKTGDFEPHTMAYKCDGEKTFREFEKSTLNKYLEGNFIAFGDKLYLMPYNLDIDKIKTVTPGLFLGILKKGRFEPSHALCLALSKDDFKSTIDVTDCQKFFGGETITTDKKGWTAVLYNNYPVGWGKASDGILKNHFPKYLRF
ncbi:MAG: RsmF rRNA methyltransferase first C-terminal domain-containing protein [Clostridia bacterium]|nr:RsmF rRNA methyltransferase first C-terminal domain-containing protein [Clostridia bacterium]